MEFSVKRHELLDELSMTQGVVERKTTIPILSNLLCEAKGSRLAITATDLELSIRTSCEAKVKKDGSATIPAKKLLELVRLLPEGEIRFKQLENHWVQIVSDRKTYKLVGMSQDNFPALPAFPHALVKIPASVMSGLIAKTTFAISLEESRYTLNGALMVLKPDSVVMVATDGHRLAMVEADHKLAGLSNEVRVLIPKKAMTEVQRLAAGASEDAQFEFAQDDSHLFFQLGGRLLTARMWALPLMGKILRGRLRLIEPLCDLTGLPMAFGVFALVLAACLPLAWLRWYAACSLIIVAVHVLTAAWAGPDFFGTLGLLALSPVYVLRKLWMIPGVLRGSSAKAAWVRTERNNTL